ncbi:MAG TPA: glutamate racemase [Gemmatimonadaceae bacterium]|jgi:glutamate racemase|nr:glutamate racemase [Gemmatimonadaceae bacterium]
MSPSQRDPIGVFDSGIGGLTVVRELVRQLPHERIIYFGDTARVPYGPKSPDTVRRYSNEIATWLTEQNVKVIVVACNTATAHALEHLQRDFPLPVIGVVQPGARAAVCATRNRRIGVIGTLGTINSGAYDRAIHAISHEAEVVAQACPLFVPLVEEGWLDTEATRLIAREYLRPFTSDHIDTLVLGCTHYPLLKPMLAELVGRDVRLIDSAEETAAETCRVLTERDLVAPPGSIGTHRFVASDAPDHFLRQGQRFLGAAIDDVEKVTLG